MKEPHKNKKNISKTKILIYTIVFLAAIVLLYICACLAPAAKLTAHRMRRQGNVYQLGKALENYNDRYHALPIFPDSNNAEMWSWRCILFQLDSLNQYNFNYFEPWNSEANMIELDKYDILKNSFSYSLWISELYERGVDDRAIIVALTGEGTAWNAINQEKKSFDEMVGMILVVETYRPVNHWAQPGDNVSPDDVVQMYRAYKKAKSKKSFFAPKSDPAIVFFSCNEPSSSFDEIENETELWKRLVLPKNNEF